MQRFIRRENNECFIGVMQYIFYKTFNTHLSEHRIKKIFNYTNKGVSVGSVLKESTAVGFMSKAFAIEKITQVSGTFIVARKIGELIHFMAYIDNMFFDPATGQISKGDLQVGDVIIEMEKINCFKPYDDIVQIEKSGSFLPVVVIIGFLGSLLSIYGSYFMKDLHTFMSLKYSLNFVLYKYLVIGFIGIMLLVAQRMVMQRLLASANLKMLAMYKDTLLSSSISITRHFTLAHIKRVASDISAYIDFDIAKKIELLNSIVLFICSLYLIANQSLILLSISLVSGFVFAFFKVLFKRKQKLNFEKLREKSLSLDDTVNHLHQNIKRAVGSDKKEYEMLLNSDVSTLVKYNLNSSKTVIGQDFLLQTVVTAFSIASPVLIYSSLTPNSLDVGGAMFLILISGFLFNNLVNILSFIISFEQNDVYRYKVSDFLIGDKRIKEKFTYDGQNTFDPLKWEKGQYQLVGNNGAGKSTMLNLFAGLESNFNEGVEYLSSESLPLKGQDKFSIRNNVSQGQRQIVNGMLLMESKAKYIILDEAFNSVKKELRQKMYDDILAKFENVIIVDHDMTLNIKNIVV